MMRFVPLIVFLVLALALGAGLLSGGARQPPDVMVGREVPQARIEGVDPAELGREVVVVNFFASWCAPCAEEQPVLAKLAQDSAVRMVGIAYKDTREAVDAWLSVHGNPFDVLGNDAQGLAAIDWGVYGVPETYVLVDGVIRHRHVGPLDEQTAARDIAPLLRGEVQ